MANEKNLLKPARDLTTSQRRENARKAGKASAEKKRQRRDMRETFAAILDMPLKEGTVEEVQAFSQAAGKNVTVGEAIAYVMANKAVKGDVRAAEFVRDTAGQKPTTQVEVSTGEHYDVFMQALQEQIDAGL